MKKVIVVGIDFSECSLGALQEGARLASLWGGALHLVHIVNTKFFEREVDESYLTEEVVLNAAREALENVASETLGADAAYQSHVAAGHPIYGLLDQVSELKADLLVLGRQGNHLKTARDPGSVSRRVATYASCSVLLVDSHRPSSEVVLACLDFSESAERAVELAAKMAVESGKDLYLLHIVPSLNELRGPYYGLTILEESDYEKLVLRDKEKLKVFAAALKEEHPVLRIETILETGAAIPCLICRTTDHVHADLVVLGASGSSGLITRFLGTNAERVNQDCACSVLTVRGEC
ncbi:MAG: universal stress protein [Roseibacillus sp.]